MGQARNEGKRPSSQAAGRGSKNNRTPEKSRIIRLSSTEKKETRKKRIKEKVYILLDKNDGTYDQINTRGGGRNLKGWDIQLLPDLIDREEIISGPWGE